MHAGAAVANYSGRDFRRIASTPMSQSNAGRGLACLPGPCLMSALVCEHWPESYTSATSISELPSLDLDIKWEGGSHEEDAIRLLKSIMEPAVKDAEPARRSRRHLERRVRRQSEDGGLVKRAKEFQQEVEVVVLDEEKTETGGKSSFFLPSPPASFSTQVVPSGEHYH